MSGFDRSAFQTARKGHCYEDFEPGRCFAHVFGRTLTEGDAVLFSTATLAYTPMYLDSVRAAAAGHPSIVVNPMLVLTTVFGLSVEDLSEGGGLFLGMDEVRFLASVYPGDTLMARSTVVDRRESDSRPTMGIVTWHTEGSNQRHEVVIEFRRTNLVMKRVG